MANLKVPLFIIIGTVLLLTGIYIAMDVTGFSRSEVIDVSAFLGDNDPDKLLLILIVGGIALIITGLSERMRALRAKERIEKQL